MKSNQSPQTFNPFDQLLSFLNGKITCKTHPSQLAKSICIDCKTFCCMVENCGHPHIYHSIENLEYLVNNQVLPLIGNLKQVNENLSQNKVNHMKFLKTFKNNLKTFAFEEKKKIDEEYRKIQNSLQMIYNSNMGDIDEFIDNLNVQFDSLQDRINSVYMYSSGSGSSESVNDINNYINNLVMNSENNEIFISSMSKDVKRLNLKMKEISNNISKFDFNKEIEELKSQAEKMYPKIDRCAYFKSLSQKFEIEKSNFLETKNKRQDRKSMSSMKKMVSRASSISPKDNYQLEVDLDIFVRSLFEEFNKLRHAPYEALSIVQDFADSFNTDESMYNISLNQSNLNETSKLQANFNSKLSYIYEYLQNLVANRVSLPPFEWDNDLSNSAEDYLKFSNGKIDRDQKNYLSNIKDIINSNYYNNYSNIHSMNYTGLVDLNKIIMNILLNDLYWDGNFKENLIFTKNFNLMGICGTAGSSYNKVVLVINLSLLNK